MIFAPVWIVLAAEKVVWTGISFTDMIETKQITMNFEAISLETHGLWLRCACKFQTRTTRKVKKYSEIQRIWILTDVATVNYTSSHVFPKDRTSHMPSQNYVFTVQVDLCILHTTSM